MKVLLQFVNKLATVEGINDAFIVATIFSINRLNFMFIFTK
ncbi:Multidrug resistance protein B [Staphylococcus aureus]|nr:Multidrug resistance protein B [Staphylococcus aureus]